MSNIKRVLGSRATLALGAWVAYVLAFIPLYRQVGQTVAALALLPVVVTGWLFGIRAGLLAGLLTFPLNMLLTAVVTGTAWAMISPEGLFGAVLILLIGAVVGRLHDLGEQMKREFAERKRAEEALKGLVKKTEQAKEEWESTADSLPELVCLVDSRGCIVRANRTVETWNLGRVVDVKGRRVHELLHPGCAGISCDLDSRWKQAWEEAVRGQPAQCEAYDEVLKRHVLVRVQPWKGEAVGSTVVVVQDITERKRAEERLKEYSERLEEMVVERTAELKTANEQLRLEIAERKQAEEALRDEKALMDALMDNITDSIYFKDRQCRLTRINRKMMRDLNLDEMSQAIGKTDVDLFGEEFGRKTLAEDQRIMATGEPIMGLIESRQLEDGQINWTLTTKVPLRDASGQIMGLAGITREINELMRVEQSLRESEERFALAVQGSNDGIWDWDIVNHTLYWSPRMKELLGYADDELDVDFDTFESHVHPDDRVRVRAAIEAHLKERGLYDVEQRLRTKSGEYRWFHARGQALWDEAGNPLRMVGSTADITERKRAEEALAQERNILRTLLDNVPDAIYFKDTESRFIRTNRAHAERWFGLSDPAQAIGKTDFDFFSEEHARQAYEDEQEIIRTGQPLLNMEERETWPDRPDTWVLTSKMPLRDEEGKIIGTFGITKDITERKRAEEQLQRYAAELERANEEIKQFAYIVSHDLRSPLVNLKGFTTELRFALETVDSAMDTALPHLDEKQRQGVIMALQEDVPEALGFIDSSVTNMDRFVSALLKLSRLGRRELHLEPVDMEALVQATLQTLAHQIEERQVKVTVGPLPEVVADRTSMEQVMANLLDNAVKYLDSDRPGQIEITAERSYDETIFRIRDNGRGIAKEDMDKVFVPFRRFGRQDVPGEGMGLPYVQALVRRHGGRIWCESELGVGTTFSFTISNHIAEGGHHE